MTRLRRLARFAYHRSASTLLRLVGGRIEILSPRSLRQAMGPADTLRIAAPGRSVQTFDPGGAAGFHVLGVNYFTDCAEVPLWRNDIFFVIEPHPDYARYADSVRRFASQRPGCFIVVKGFGSPKKLLMAVRLVRALAEIPGVTVLLANDLYIADLPQASYAEAIVAHPDAIVSGGKTLMWALSFGYVAGYSKIALHGFDFSEAYAYSGASSGGAEAPQANIWANDAAVRDGVLSEVARLAVLLKERGVELVQGGCEGPLRTLLAADSGRPA